MWYDPMKKRIDYSRAIFATSKSNGKVYVLIPRTGENYAVIGYDWFNFKTGEFNSCRHFGTVEEAMATYEYDHTFANGELVKKDA